MAGEWKRYTIDQLKADTNASIAIGPFGSRMKSDTYVGFGVPVIRGNNISDTKEFLDDFVYITPEFADQLKSQNVVEGDLVFPHRGNIGTVGIVGNAQPRYVLSTSLMKVTCNRSLVEPLFLFYFFRSAVGHHELMQHASTVGTPGIGTPLTSLRSISVILPPLPEQQAIACILGALDDKIELNRRMNRTLEATARAIFKSWFVDFDPVRAKAAGRQPPGLKPELAALFPDGFEDSELGHVPRGWIVTSLAEQITARKGLSYKGEYLCEPGEGLPMHNLNSVYEGGGYKNEGLKWYNGEYRPGHLLKPQDVIVTNTEQGFDYLLIGYAAIVPGRYGPHGLFSHHIFRIEPKNTSHLPAWFIYLLLRTQRFHDLVAGHSNGTTVNMLPLDGLQKPTFVLPPKGLVDRFGGLFAPVQRRLERIHDENIALATCRDALLPKLVSGELLVREAERIAGRYT